MTFRLGLTGSIGMGKSTTAKMFAEEGVPVWDADATVHRLYKPGQPAMIAIGHLFPDAIVDGAVSRQRLRALIAHDSSVLDRVQAVVHPLVAANRAEFLASHPQDIVVLDIPLLYETNADASCNGVVVVTAPADVQRARVLSRGQMTEAEFDVILSRQMQDAEKRARATWVIETLSFDLARAAVKSILADIRQRIAHA